MVAVLGLSTSFSAWVLLLMKLCADFCHRAAPPARLLPSPMRMLVGMSSVTNCFTTGGVQPTIQADMRDRSAFTSALAAVFLGEGRSGRGGGPVRLVEERLQKGLGAVTGARSVIWI